MPLSADPDVRDREQWLLTMVENLPVGAILLKHQELRMNRMAEQMTGFSRHDITTRDAWFKSLMREMYEQAKAIYLEDRKMGLRRVAEVPFYKKDGELRMGEFVATIVGDYEIWIMRDITDTKRTEERINTLNDRLARAMNAGGVGIWEADLTTGQFLYNEQMYEIYKIGDTGFHAGVSPNTFGGNYEDWLKVIHPDDIPSVIDTLNEMVKTTATLHYEHRIIRPSGEIRYVRSSGQALLNDEGVPYRAVGTTLDITEHKALTQALSEAKEAAEAAERAKGEFLASMSHEIRTPMNTVLGMTRLALQTELTPKQYNYLDKIDLSARTLIGIINDILDFSKIEAGKLELEAAEFTLESVLESVAAVTVIKAEEKGLEVVFSVGEGVPSSIVADPLRLGQILINLVNNAIKFTEHGEIVVSIQKSNTVPDKPDGLVLQFSVRDSGIGLEESQVDQLFQAFSQGDRGTARKYGGTGLGLSICKQLATAMGGRIWATGKPGQGSTFSFTIEATLPPQKRAAPAPDIRGLAGRRVLIVDDNTSAREILADMVRRFGMEAEVTDSGPAAIKMLQQASRNKMPFELVLMDWRMPDMDGLEAAEHIKNDPELQYTPAVLMVTAFGREEILQRSEQLGLDGVLIKPVTDSVMFNTIADVLGYTTGEHRVFHATHTITPPGSRRKTMPSPASLHALANRTALVVDDNALNREVVTDFLLAVGMHIDIATNGLEAIKRLAERTYDVVLMDVHMPQMDGLTAAREIRMRTQWKDLPIVALTAQAQADDRNASLAAGMNAHITKPIDEAILYQTLLRLLAPQAGTGHSEPALMNTDDIAWPASLPGIDLSVALAHLSGKRERVVRFMRGFIRDFSGTPAQVLLDADAENFDTLTTTAHTIKSAAAYLGAHDLTQAAAALEQAARTHDATAVRTHLSAFRTHLEQVLQSLHGAFANGHDTTAPLERLARDTIFQYIAQVEPLVAQGNYAALPLLDSIVAHLGGTSAAPLADMARQQFEELELQKTKITLRKLRDAVAQFDVSRA